MLGPHNENHPSGSFSVAQRGGEIGSIGNKKPAFNPFSVLFKEPLVGGSVVSGADDKGSEAIGRTTGGLGGIEG